MLAVKPFPALYYDPARVRLSAVWGSPRPEHGREHLAQWHGEGQGEPRGIEVLCRRATRDGEISGTSTVWFAVADWLRAGILQRSAGPCFVYLRQRPASAIGVLREGFFALIDPAHLCDRVLAVGPRGGHGADAPWEQPSSALRVDPDLYFFDDRDQLVERAFREALERAPDCACLFDGWQHEVWLVGDPIAHAAVARALTRPEARASAEGPGGTGQVLRTPPLPTNPDPGDAWRFAFCAAFDTDRGGVRQRWEGGHPRRGRIDGHVPYVSREIWCALSDDERRRHTPQIPRGVVCWLPGLFSSRGAS